MPEFTPAFCPSNIPFGKGARTVRSLTAITDTNDGRLFLALRPDDVLEIVNARLDEGRHYGPIVKRWKEIDRDHVKLDANTFVETAARLNAFFWNKVNPGRQDRFLRPSGDSHLVGDAPTFIRGNGRTSRMDRMPASQLVRPKRPATAIAGTKRRGRLKIIDDPQPSFCLPQSRGLDSAPFLLIKALVLIGRENAFTGTRPLYNGGHPSRVSGYTRYLARSKSPWPPTKIRLLLRAKRSHSTHSPFAIGWSARIQQKRDRSVAGQVREPGSMAADTLPIEDNEVDAKLFGTIIGHQPGLRAHHVRSASEAFARPERHQPRLIHADVTMPSVTGWDVVERNPPPKLSRWSSSVQGDPPRSTSAPRRQLAAAPFAKPIAAEAYRETIRSLPVPVRQFQFR